MATQIMKGLRWKPGEVYVCADPHCRAKVLVLSSPGKYLDQPTPPTCVCGSVLELEGSVAPVAGGASSSREYQEEERE